VQGSRTEARAHLQTPVEGFAAEDLGIGGALELRETVEALWGWPFRQPIEIAIWSSHEAVRARRNVHDDFSLWHAPKSSSLCWYRGPFPPAFRCSNLEVDKFPSEGLVMAHTVYCVKLKRELPGLDEPPFDNDLGRKVYDNVSQEAWRMWTEHCKMLLNEYRLNPARREDQEVIVKQLDQFFFGEGSAVPKEYVPPAQK